MKTFITIAVVALVVVGAIGQEADTTTNETPPTSSATTVGEQTETTANETPATSPATTAEDSSDTTPETSSATGKQDQEGVRFLGKLAEALGGGKRVEVSSDTEYGSPYGYQYVERPPPPKTTPEPETPSLFDPLIKIFKFGQKTISASAPEPSIFDPITKLFSGGASISASKTLNPLAKIFKADSGEDQSPVTVPTRRPTHRPPPPPPQPLPPYNYYPGYFPYPPPPPYPYANAQFQAQLTKYGKKFAPYAKVVPHNDE